MTAEQAFHRLSSLCARAEYCAADLCAKMDRWGIDKREQAMLIRRLEDGNYINETRYCRLFARDKLRFNRWGRAKIRLAAAAKQLDKEALDDALTELDDEEYAAILRAELQRKSRTIKSGSAYDRRAKLFRFALGKGFTAAEIADALSAL